MEYKEALESMKLKFTSGNKYPVNRASIDREEWDAILKEIFYLEELTNPNNFNGSY